MVSPTNFGLTILSFSYLILAMVALFIGWQKIFLVIFLSFVTGALAGLLLLLIGKKKLRDPIPFGPFIALGTLLVVNWGYDMARWYLQLYN